MNGVCSNTQRIVAVSKTKPVEALREAYDAGHKVLGENYVQVRSNSSVLVPVKCCLECTASVHIVCLCSGTA